MGGTAYGKNMQIYMFALRLLHGCFTGAGQ